MRSKKFSCTLRGLHERMSIWSSSNHSLKFSLGSLHAFGSYLMDTSIRLQNALFMDCFGWESENQFGELEKETLGASGVSEGRKLLRHAMGFVRVKLVLSVGWSKWMESIGNVRHVVRRGAFLDATLLSLLRARAALERETKLRRHLRAQRNLKSSGEAWV